ncbi:MAG: FAD-dependent oxidoreductase [Pseudomonadota bacterium]
MKFVIIGGDAAGMSAASRCRRMDPSIEVTVLEQTRDVSYSACGMPYNIADPARHMDDLVVRPAVVFRDKLGIDVRLGMRAEVIDRGARVVRGRTADGGDFQVPYDKLLIAVGAGPITLSIPGAELEGVMALKSLEDGRAVKDFLHRRSVERALIIGMGYIGLEMAEAFHARGVAVEMAKPGRRLLPWMPDELAAVVKEELEAKGVTLLLGNEPAAMEKADSGLKVTYKDGSTSSVGMVMMGIGVAPNSEIAANAGLDLGPKRSIAVDRTLRTSDPDIFAAGDCADAFHVVTGRRVWIPLALRANRAGWAVADNVAGRVKELPGIVGTAVFKAFDLEIARSGLSLSEARAEGFDAVETVISSRSRAHAHPGNQRIHVALTGDRKSGRLLGAAMVGREGVAHRINAVAVALHAAMTVEEFSQCDMAYAPPFGPVWDPLLTAGNQLLKTMGLGPEA